MDIVEKLAIIGILSMSVIFSLAVVMAYLWIEDSIRRYLYEKEEKKRRDFLKIRNHKHADYIFVPHKNGMYEIRGRES